MQFHKWKKFLNFQRVEGLFLYTYYLVGELQNITIVKLEHFVNPNQAYIGKTCPFMKLFYP